MNCYRLTSTNIIISPLCVLFILFCAHFVQMPPIRLDHFKNIRLLNVGHSILGAVLFCGFHRKSEYMTSSYYKHNFESSRLSIDDFYKNTINS